MKNRTHLPVIVDPSHGIGIRSLVPQMAYAAAASGCDGLIVEVHPHPEQALSDGQQTLNFAEFEILVKQLEKILDALGRPLSKK